MANKYDFNEDKKKLKEREEECKTLSQEIKNLEEKKKKYEKAKQDVEKYNKNLEAKKQAMQEKIGKATDDEKKAKLTEQSKNLGEEKKIADIENKFTYKADEGQENGPKANESDESILEAKKKELEGKQKEIKSLKAGLRAETKQAVKDNFKNFPGKIKSAVVRGVHAAKHIGDKNIKFAWAWYIEEVKKAYQGLEDKIKALKTNEPNYLIELLPYVQGDRIYNNMVEIEKTVKNLVLCSGKKENGKGKSTDFLYVLNRLIVSIGEMRVEDVGDAEMLNIKMVKQAKLLECTKSLKDIVTKISEVSLLYPFKKDLVPIFKTLHEKVADYIAYRDALTKEGKMAPVREAAITAYDAKTLLKDAGVSKLYDKLKKDTTEMPKKVKDLTAKITKASKNRKLNQDAKNKLIAEVKALGEERISIVKMAQNFIEHEGDFAKLGEIGLDADGEPVDAYKILLDEIDKLGKECKINSNMESDIKKLETEANYLQVVAD